MKTQVCIYSRIALFICGMFFLSACTKDSNPAPIRAIDAISLPQEVLIAPFPNIGPTGNFLSGTLIKTDYNGKVIKQKTLSAAGFDFKRWVIRGRVLYSYVLFDPNPQPLVGWLAGTVIITDSELNTIAQIRLKGHPGHDTRIDGHDFILLDYNHYIVEAYYEKVVTNIPDSIPHGTTVKVLTPLIQEVKNNQVIFEWDASNYPEFYAASVEGNNFTSPDLQDYMHLNSVFIDPKDNNLILSFRQTDQVIKINRTTGNIIWRLGGKKSDFPMTANQKFLRQHDAKITVDRTLTLVDNGLVGVRPYSRLVEFVLDETTKTIRSYRALNLPSAAFMTYMGSVQKVNGNYFVGGGSLPAVFEINGTTGKLISGKPLPSNSYRAYKY